MSFGFNLPGAIAVALVLLPNIVWAIKPPKDDPLRSKKPVLPVLEAAENIGRFLTMAAAAMTVGQAPFGVWRYIVPTLAALSLLIYWVAWVLYYRGVSLSKLDIPMCVAPVAAMVLGAVFAGSLIVVIPAALFLAAHLIISLRNYGKTE